jgi:lipase chaperone LimK
MSKAQVEFVMGTPVAANVFRHDVWHYIFNMNAGTSAADWQTQRQQALGPEAAARLAALDAEDSAWELRMDLARHAVRTLAIRAELSSLQRDQALQQWLDAHFKPQEQVRVRALLGA